MIAHSKVIRCASYVITDFWILMRCGDISEKIISSVISVTLTEGTFILGRLNHYFIGNEAVN